MLNIFLCLSSGRDPNRFKQEWTTEKKSEKRTEQKYQRKVKEEDERERGWVRGQIPSKTTVMA